MTEPILENQYHTDSSLRRVVGLFLPHKIINSTTIDFSRFGDEVISKKVLDWVTDAERNTPHVRGYGRNALGRRTDELITSEGWRKLQELGLREGIVAIAYENDYAEFSRVVQFVKYHLWTGSCAYVTCPSAMQDGAATLLKRHLYLSSSSSDSHRETVFRMAYHRLISRDKDAWTSGQWMTERIGGSDVSGTETLATYAPDSSPESTQIDGSPLGPWVIDGFKWFSSATDSQMSIALAQTPKGLSAFYIPMRRTNANGETELNGISISRLKNKMGTKALPTAELELKGARAYLLGNEGDGIREISIVLNITRIHTAATALGLFGRGLAIAKAFTNVRELAGKGRKTPLKDVPLHIRTLSQTTLLYRENMLFTYFVTYLLGISDQPAASTTSEQSTASSRLRPQTSSDLQFIFRIITGPLKAVAAKASISGLQECMEALGGIGYLENEESQHINVARLYRDVNVLAIWEGTTNVLGTDFVKILKGRNGFKTLEALSRWVTHALSDGDGAFVAEKQFVEGMLREFRTRIHNGEVDGLVSEARELMDEFAAVVKGTLMIVDAERDKDAVSGEFCHRFFKAHGLDKSNQSAWKHRSGWDAKIVFGGVGELGAPKPHL